MQKLADARKQFWSTLQPAREAIITATDDPRRRASGTNVKFLLRMVQAFKQAQSASADVRAAFQNLIHPVWIDRYLSERITPMREELLFVAPRIKQLEPAAYAAEIKMDFTP